MHHHGSGRARESTGAHPGVRQEAEAITERVTRELYDKQQGLLLVAAVARAANDATGIEDAIATSLEAIRAHRLPPFAARLAPSR